MKHKGTRKQEVFCKHEAGYLPQCWEDKSESFMNAWRSFWHRVIKVTGHCKRQDPTGIVMGLGTECSLERDDRTEQAND